MDVGCPPKLLYQLLYSQLGRGEKIEQKAHGLREGQEDHSCDVMGKRQSKSKEG